MARRGKNDKREVVSCELDLAYRLLAMRERVLAGFGRRADYGRELFCRRLGLSKKYYKVP